MKKSISVVPPNSLILVMDRSIGEVPESMNKHLVSANATCIAVGTRSAADGKTRIVLTDDSDSEVGGLERVFDGFLKTPSLELSVCSIMNFPFLNVKVPESPTYVQIWANDKMEPDEIRVIVLSRSQTK